MKNVKLIIGIFFLILIISGSILATKTLAQSPTPANYDVTVSPVFFDLSANPGDSLSNRIRFRNNTNSPLPIKLTVQKMTGDTNGELTLRDDKNDSSLSWIKFSSDTFVAKPLEWTDVPFTIDIPKDAAYGYYFAVSFTQDNTSPIKRTGTTITGAAAVPILLDVKKAGAKAQAKIIQFSVDNYINEYLPVNFSVKVENQGNIHVSPHGNIFISEGNNDLASLDVNPTLGNIIPNTNKTLTAAWNDGFLVREPIMEDGQVKLDKNGKQLERIIINWNKLTSFRIGKYTANLLLVYDNGTRDVPLEASVSFWVFPWKVMGLLLIFLIVAVVLARFLLKFYINREVKRRLKN
jgi:hypothetical protein